MASPQDRNTGLNALADAATEVESSLNGDDESETHSLHNRNRASHLFDTVTELREMMGEMSATFSDQMNRLQRRMDSLERESGTLSLPNTSVRCHDPPSVSSNSRCRYSPYKPPWLWANRLLNKPLPHSPWSGLTMTSKSRPTFLTVPRWRPMTTMATPYTRCLS